MFEMCAKCLIVIGSSTNTMSMRHFFSYEQRRKFLRIIYPEPFPIVGLPDYNSDKVWLSALDDILLSVFGNESISPHRELVFFGGCEEDVEFFIKSGRKVYIMNRFDGTTPKVSATEIRDDLLYGRLLEGKLPPVIIPSVREEFKKNWEVFKRI